MQFEPSDFTNQNTLETRFKRYFPAIFAPTGSSADFFRRNMKKPPANFQKTPIAELVQLLRVKFKICETPYKARKRHFCVFDNKHFFLVIYKGSGHMNWTHRIYTLMVMQYPNMDPQKKSHFKQKKMFTKFNATFWYYDELGLAIKDEKYGFINEKGETIVPLIYDDAFPFYKGYASVKKNDKWNYVNKNGKNFFIDL